MNIHGIIPAMITPLDKEQRLHRAATISLTRYLLNQSIHGLFILGTNGEFHMLSEEEKIAFTEIVSHETDSKVPLIVGAGGNSTEEVIRLSHKLEQAGADVLSVITPYFIQPSQKELIEHYKTIAANTTLPILIYNIPSKTGVSIEPEAVKELAPIQNIVGIKDSSGDFQNTNKYIQMTNDQDFVVLAGTDSLILQTLQAGGTGAVAATANIIPEQIASIYKHWKSGNIEAAERAQESVNPLRDLFKLGTIPSVVKKAVEVNGYEAGPPKSPVAEADSIIAQKLSNVLRELKSERN
ncbi:4-hydroxy-tetrahydrodipicolinate synthase [Halalkalibacter sp. APA_J-10(15)]|uniref:4-hydroxy-tetrahydrodipicolinate synthase n=1 Tax=Halalkalibacter sp. APA_J-10(15) TaxID=2933805 RepID=UPI001FF5F394|nr:4-hydroxy-tetrahydrodipicolinate synthase [Halalkalibacter sp. APA_J-10(15)]MCK0470143.1 4-hydroxy-tetrahydrodipicolinate synthase [Halalkalibacter sp. APA_J-10(15)]